MSNNEPTLRPPRGEKERKERRKEKPRPRGKLGLEFEILSHFIRTLYLEIRVSYKGISLDNWIFGFDGILIRARTIEIEDETRADRREEG